MSTIHRSSELVGKPVTRRSPWPNADSATKLGDVEDANNAKRRVSSSPPCAPRTWPTWCLGQRYPLGGGQRLTTMRMKSAKTLASTRSLPTSSSSLRERLCWALRLSVTSWHGRVKLVRDCADPLSLRRDYVGCRGHRGYGLHQGPLRRALRGLVNEVKSSRSSRSLAVSLCITRFIELTAHWRLSSPTATRDRSRGYLEWFDWR